MLVGGGGGGGGGWTNSCTNSCINGHGVHQISDISSMEKGTKEKGKKTIITCQSFTIYIYDK